MDILNQNFIALDLEMNQPSNKIIQVGVCVGNISCFRGEYPEFDMRCYYIDPQESIDPYIVNLTSITDQDIKNKAVPFQIVAESIESLMQEYSCFPNPITWGSGDMHLLLSAFKENDIEFDKFGRRFIDVKTISTFLDFSINKTYRGGLHKTLRRWKLNPFGQAHLADFDAYNTLKLYFAILKRQYNIENTMENIKTLIRT